MGEGSFLIEYRRTPGHAPICPLNNQALEYLQKRGLEKGIDIFDIVMPNAVMIFYAQPVKPGTARTFYSVLDLSGKMIRDFIRCL